MRFRLSLTPQSGPINTIPVNYQYPLSAWIYITIHNGDHAFASFLHNKGFVSGGKTYKLFTFSMLSFPNGGYRIEGDRMHISAGEAILELSFLAPDATQHFISGLFKRQLFRIGDSLSQTSFRVTQVDLLPQPVFTGCMTFRACAPILISQHTDGRRSAAYCKPGDQGYEKLFFDHLTAKFAAAMQSGLIDPDFDKGSDSSLCKLRILSPPKTKGIHIKTNTPQQTQIIGYLFDFEIEAPPPLIRLGYDAGFGEKNSLGMGCCTPQSHLQAIKRADQTPPV